VLERHLQDRRRSQIAATNDPIDIALGIVEYRREVIAVGAVSSPKNGIAKKFRRVPGKIESAFVSERGLTRIEV